VLGGAYPFEARAFLVKEMLLSEYEVGSSTVRFRFD
jgi:hypothetical protein